MKAEAKARALILAHVPCEDVYIRELARVARIKKRTLQRVARALGGRTVDT